MDLGFSFFFTSIMLGAGLAMDAFSVSLANGLNEPKMKQARMCGVAGVFSFFPFAMPLIGWICVSTVAKLFGAFEKSIPWIALGLLGVGKHLPYSAINYNTLKEYVWSVMTDAGIEENMVKVQELIKQAPGNAGGAEMIIQYYKGLG